MVQHDGVMAWLHEILAFLVARQGLSTGNGDTGQGARFGRQVSRQRDPGRVRNASPSPPVQRPRHRKP